VTPEPGGTFVECGEEGTVQTGSVETSTGPVIPFQIYLPPCYERQTGAAYPVLYLFHGGGGDESSWNQAGAAEVANRAIRTGEVPPFILVTPDIQHHQSRQDVALVDDLVPYIDAHFRTLADRRHRAVGGASGGASLAAWLAFRFPDLFGSTGIFGGGVFTGDTKAFDALISSTPAEGWPRVLIDVGDEDDTRAVAVRTAKILDQHDIPCTLTIGSGEHSYAYWVGRLQRYLRWYAEGW
jgi:enterochelin esterase-like enzyme